MAATLKRRIGLGLLTAYGVGVMVGAGIYVLVGAVAGEAGAWTPVAFLLAGLIAAPSALSYAELATRFPEAAGEAAYVGAGYPWPGLGTFVGLAIVAAGTVSAAAVLRGGGGYLSSVTGWADPAIIVVLGAGLTGVAILGALESLSFAAVLTAVEVAGLIMVVGAGLWATPVVAEAHATPASQGLPVLGIMMGASLAFFAFIGFEDIVNMAEEVRDPMRTLPRAILLSLVITTLLYALVSYAAVRAVPAGDLAASNRPLALVWERATGQGAWVLALIAVAAALNGVLAQIVMAARVLFGIGRRSAILAVFHQTAPRFGTPVRATALLGTLVICAALILPVAELARATSLILLSVFLLVNGALIRIKHRTPGAAFAVPVWVPWAGLAASGMAIAFSLGGGM